MTTPTPAARLRKPAQIAADLERYARDAREYAPESGEPTYYIRCAETCEEAAQALRAQPTVTDAMVEATAIQFFVGIGYERSWWSDVRSELRERYLQVGRNALAAALTGEPA
jgi:hypothetical protein